MLGNSLQLLRAYLPRPNPRTFVTATLTMVTVLVIAVHLVHSRDAFREGTFGRREQERFPRLDPCNPAPGDPGAARPIIQRSACEELAGLEDGERGGSHGQSPSQEARPGVETGRRQSRRTAKPQRSAGRRARPALARIRAAGLPKLADDTIGGRRGEWTALRLSALRLPPFIFMVVVVVTHGGRNTSGGYRRRENDGACLRRRGINSEAGTLHDPQPHHAGTRLFRHPGLLGHMRRQDMPPVAALRRSNRPMLDPALSVQRSVAGATPRPHRQEAPQTSRVLSGLAA